MSWRQRDDHDCPPWWPIDEPWPPRFDRQLWGRGRRRFLFRSGIVFIPALIVGAIGLARLVRAIVERAGIDVPPQLVTVAFLVLAWVVAAVFFGGMRRVGMPLG